MSFLDIYIKFLKLQQAVVLRGATRCAPVGSDPPKGVGEPLHHVLLRVQAFTTRQTYEPERSCGGALTGIEAVARGHIQLAIVGEADSDGSLVDRGRVQTGGSHLPREILERCAGLSCTRGLGSGGGRAAASC